MSPEEPSNGVSESARRPVRECAAETDYYARPRIELLEWIGSPGERVLDVGCGAGANAEWLRARGARYIEGVEPTDSAVSAEAVYDRVHHATIENASLDLDGPFDLIICADVLEHLAEPWVVLRDLRQHLRPHGRLAASIPNVRYLPALFRIAFGAGFRPETSGTFDRTHLRFFTRRNIEELLRDSGWRPVRWEQGRYTWRGSLRRALGRFTFGVTNEWLVGQWFVEAVPS